MIPRRRLMRRLASLVLAMPVASTSEASRRMRRLLGIIVNLPPCYHESLRKNHGTRQQTLGKFEISRRLDLERRTGLRGVDHGGRQADREACRRRPGSADEADRDRRRSCVAEATVHDERTDYRQAQGGAG